VSAHALTHLTEGRPSG